MVDLERAVGIKRGALYYHIRSKEQLLFEVMVRHVHESIDAANAVVAAVDDPLLQIRDIARQHMRLIALRREECIVWLREAHALNGEYAEQVHALREEYEAIVAKAFRRAVRAKQLRSADPIAVKGFLGLIGYSYLWMDPEGKRSPEAVADRLVDLAMFGLITDAAREAIPPARRPR